MKRSTKIKWGEIRVGLLIAFALAVLLYASFVGHGTSIFEAKQEYRAYFANVNGLVKGSPVWVAGVEVGNVTSVEFVNLDSARQIEISFKVLEKVRNMLTTSARIKLGTIGFIGDKYVEIIPGRLADPQLEPGVTIPSVSAGDLDAVFAEGEKAVADTREMMENLTDITERINRGEGSLGKLFTQDTLHDEMTRLVAGLTILVNDLQRNQERIAASLENVSSDIGEISGRINASEGTLGRIISDPALYDNVHSSTGRIDSMLARLSEGQGTAGAMLNDDELYEEIKNLIVRIENLVSDIEENPRKYFKFSVF